jgi:hypothetical protein
MKPTMAKRRVGRKPGTKSGSGRSEKIVFLAGAASLVDPWLGARQSPVETGLSPHSRSAFLREGKRALERLARLRKPQVPGDQDPSGPQPQADRPLLQPTRPSESPKSAAQGSPMRLADGYESRGWIYCSHCLRFIKSAQWIVHRAAPCGRKAIPGGALDASPKLAAGAPPSSKRRRGGRLEEGAAERLRRQQGSPAGGRKCRYCTNRAMDGGDCCYQHNPE